MTTPTYRIKDWDLHFENSESRKVKKATWLPIKNKHDGKGFRRVMRHERGPEIFAAWVLILQLASKMPSRGVLADQDGPLTCPDMSDCTGMSREIFELALNFLSEPQIGWIEEISSQDIRTHPDAPGSFRVEGKGTEGKGREGKGEEPKTIAPPTKEFGLQDEKIRSRLRPLIDRKVVIESVNDSSLLDDWIRDTHDLTAEDVVEIISERAPAWPSEFRPMRDVWLAKHSDQNRQEESERAKAIKMAKQQREASTLLSVFENTGVVAKYDMIEGLPMWGVLNSMTKEKSKHATIRKWLAKAAGLSEAVSA